MKRSRLRRLNKDLGPIIETTNKRNLITVTNPNFDQNKPVNVSNPDVIKEFSKNPDYTPNKSEIERISKIQELLNITDPEEKSDAAIKLFNSYNSLVSEELVFNRIVMQILLESVDNLKDTPYYKTNIKNYWTQLMKHYEKEIAKEYDLFFKVARDQDEKRHNASDNFTMMLTQRIELTVKLLMNLELRFYAKIPPLFRAYELNPELIESTVNRILIENGEQ